MKKILVGMMFVVLILVAAWPLAAEELATGEITREDITQARRETVCFDVEPPGWSFCNLLLLSDPTVEYGNEIPLPEPWCRTETFYGPCKEIPLPEQ
jgi:hypothetical protein